MKPHQGEVKAVFKDDQKVKNDEENDDDVEYIDFEKWMNEHSNIFQVKNIQKLYTIHTLIK